MSRIRCGIAVGMRGARYLAFGVVASVLVAWAIDPSWRGTNRSQAIDVAPIVEGPELKSWPLPLPAAFGPRPDHDGQWYTNRVDVVGLTWHTTRSAAHRSFWPELEDLQIGVPFRCVRRFEYSDSEHATIRDTWNRGVELPSYFAGGEAVLAIRPLAGGLLGNTAFYGGTGWAALWAFRRVVTSRRTSSCGCPDCGYPEGVSAVCTECGRARK